MQKHKMAVKKKAGNPIWTNVTAHKSLFKVSLDEKKSCGITEFFVVSTQLVFTTVS